MKFHPGDLVKLTDRYAKTLMTNNYHRGTVDWATRRGVVHNVNSNSAAVIWTDRASLDYVPNAGLELV